MTGLAGKSDFCFPKTFNVSQGETKGTIVVEGKNNSPCPLGQSFSAYCWTMPHTSDKSPDKKSMPKDQYSPLKDLCISITSCPWQDCFVHKVITAVPSETCENSIYLMNLLKFVSYCYKYVITETDHCLGITKKLKKVIYYLKRNNLQVLDLFFYQTWNKNKTTLNFLEARHVTRLITWLS